MLSLVSRKENIVLLRETTEYNIEKTKKFIDFCHRFNIKKFIFLSSSNVYNFKSNKIRSAKESDIFKPDNYYGKTKVVIEKYLKKKFKICYILRLFNIAGYTNKRVFYEFKNNYRRIMPVITEAFKKNSDDTISDFQIKFETYLEENYRWIFLFRSTRYIYIILPFILILGFIYYRYKLGTFLLLFY